MQRVQTRSRRRLGESIRHNRTVILLSIFLLAIGWFAIFPFLWMLSSSFKEAGSLYVFPPQFIPRPFTIEP
jgi:multiple sugar transport system permease protein